MSFSCTALLFARCVACRILVEWPSTTALEVSDSAWRSEGSSVAYIRTNGCIDICAGLDQTPDRVGPASDSSVVKCGSPFSISHVDVDLVGYATQRIFPQQGIEILRHGSPSLVTFDSAKMLFADKCCDWRVAL